MPVFAGICAGCYIRSTREIRSRERVTCATSTYGVLSKQPPDRIDIYVAFYPYFRGKVRFNGVQFAFLVRS